MPKGIKKDGTKLGFKIKNNFGKLSSGMKGRKHSEETKKKISYSLIGNKNSPEKEKHYNWKGNNVGYMGIHKWLKVNFVKPIS